LSKIAGFVPDTQLYPEFDENLREAMSVETKLFVGDQLRQDRSMFAFAVQSSPVQSFAGQPGVSMKGDAKGRDRKSSVMVADDKAGWAGLLAD
jgi:hypothetical protein